MWRLIRPSTRRATEISLAAANERNQVKTTRIKNQEVYVDTHEIKNLIMPKVVIEDLGDSIRSAYKKRYLDISESEQNKKRKIEQELSVFTGELGENDTTSECLATLIPTEIFIHICKYLPPADLLRLSRTCKTYRDKLFSKESITTQQIWSTSRQEFLGFLSLPPPDGMDEISYVCLVLERGCQLCGAKTMRNVYWAFRVRLCNSCFDKKTISNHRLAKDERFNGDLGRKILSGLPYVEATFSSPFPGNKCMKFKCKYYWLEDVERNRQEFMSIPLLAQVLWVNEKNKEGARFMKEVRTREQAFKKELSRELTEKKKFSIFGRHSGEIVATSSATEPSSPSHFDEGHRRRRSSESASQSFTSREGTSENRKHKKQTSKGKGKRKSFAVNAVQPDISTVDEGWEQADERYFNAHPAAQSRKLKRSGNTMYRKPRGHRTLRHVELAPTSNPAYSNDPTDLEDDNAPLPSYDHRFPWVPKPLHPPQLIHATLVPLPHNRTNHQLISDPSRSSIVAVPQISRRNSKIGPTTTPSSNRASRLINPKRLSRVGSQRKRTSIIVTGGKRSSVLLRRQLLEDSIMMSLLGGAYTVTPRNNRASVLLGQQQKTVIRRKTKKG
ncbi:2287_t:CDS:2, partial [Ambispora gerdemannii]